MKSPIIGPLSSWRTCPGSGITAAIAGVPPPHLALAHVSILRGHRHDSPWRGREKAPRTAASPWVRERATRLRGLSVLARLGCVGGDGRGTWIHGDAVVLHVRDAPVAERLCRSAGGLPAQIDGMARNAAVPGFAGEVPR